MDFIMGLPKSDEGCGGILTVANSTIEMAHLTTMNQIILPATIAHVRYNNDGKFHGIPHSMVSDIDPEFLSKFWQKMY